MRLLLDTHILLWWLSDDPKLAKNARDIIANPENDVLVSPASAWEISFKAALGRLEIELDELEEAIVKNGPVIADRIKTRRKRRAPAQCTS